MMRALTCTQPWAGLMAAGHKPIENRPRRMIKREDFGKPFALHASREIDEDVYDFIKRKDPSLFTTNGYRSWYWLSRITSAVISTHVIERDIYQGASVLSGINAPASLTDDEALWFFDDRPGNVGYVLRDRHLLREPVPCRGWQGFWRLDSNTEDAVRRQLAEAA